MTGVIQNKFLITGCSGGGKSTLLAELARAGYATVAEPGRRVIAAARATGSDALPWENLGTFLTEALDMAHADLTSAPAKDGPTFYDRGVLDAAVALRYLNGTPLQDSLRGPFPYACTVFVAPPWPEIYEHDADRAHGFSQAKSEYDRIQTALSELQLDPVMLPKSSVAGRLEFVRERVTP